MPATFPQDALNARNIILDDDLVKLWPLFLMAGYFFFSLLAAEVDYGSLKRLGPSRLLPSNLRTLQNTVSSSLNPEGIYV